MLEDVNNIIDSMIEHSLNVDVIAESMETEEQQAFLQDNGCKQYQGYLFGKPVPIDAFNQQLLISISHA